MKDEEELCVTIVESEKKAPGHELRKTLEANPRCLFRTSLWLGILF